MQAAHTALSAQGGTHLACGVPNQSFSVKEPAQVTVYRTALGWVLQELWHTPHIIERLKYCARPQGAELFTIYKFTIYNLTHLKFNRLWQQRRLQ